MKTIIYCLLSFISLSSWANKEDTKEASSALTPEQEYAIQAEKTWAEMKPQTGVIEIKQAGAKLNVPDAFYYLDSKDANTVLVDIWGNPPGQPTLGMLFPANSTPFDSDAWAVTIEYEEDGYVSDEDADDINYTDLLTQMKEDTNESNKYRVEQGYPTIELIGWASAPFYDAKEHKLHWAKEIKFDGQNTNTLNYNIRILGRKGVLVLNFIAGIDQKEIIDQNLASVLALADFDQGSTYADFDPDMDTVAAYGLGALVAGKVLAKTGFIALALIFLKKFGVFILVGIGALFKGFISKKKKA